MPMAALLWRQVGVSATGKWWPSDYWRISARALWLETEIETHNSIPNKTVYPNCNPNWPES